MKLKDMEYLKEIRDELALIRKSLEILEHERELSRVDSNLKKLSLGNNYIPLLRGVVR